LLYVIGVIDMYAGYTVEKETAYMVKEIAKGKAEMDRKKQAEAKAEMDRKQATLGNERRKALIKAERRGQVEKGKVGIDALTSY
jgi:hypothetical protein